MVRKGVEKLVSSLEECKDNQCFRVFIAPTGYGKTISSPLLLDKARRLGLAYGLIHVVPLRSLLREIYIEKFRNTGFLTGYQSMDYIREGIKSPYYLRELIVTTLDSFFYNIYRIPIAEFHKIAGRYSHGHYYPIYLSLYSSIVVFDEAHMYLGYTDKPYIKALLLSIIEFLANRGIPIVIETATMKTDFLADIIHEANKYIKKDSMKILYVRSSRKINPQIKRLKSIGLEVEEIYDKEYTNENNIVWNTELINKESIINKILEYCNSETVLVIRNTIAKTVETYKMIGEKCNKKVLIHGLLDNIDRDKAVDLIEEINRLGRGVIVATQVVEAGVEINSRIIITDPAPIENLVQRIGRLCRGKYRKTLDVCKYSKDGAIVYIVKADPRDIGRKYDGIYNGKLVKETITWIRDNIDKNREIEWRLFDNITKKNKDLVINYISFVDLLENENYIEHVEDKSTLHQFTSEYLKHDIPPGEIIDYFEGIGIYGLRNIPLTIGYKRDEELRYLILSLEKFRSLVKAGCIMHKQIYDKHKPYLLVTVRTSDKINRIYEVLSNGFIEDLIYGNSFRKIINIYKPEKISILPDQKVLDTYIELDPRCYEEGLGVILETK